MDCNNNRKEIRSVIESEEFYYLKLQKIFKDFEEYSINNNDLDLLLKSVNTTPFKFKDFLEQNNQFTNFIILMGKIICMCDQNGYNKEEWNLYHDKRVLAKANVRQNIWTKNLLLYKKNKKLDDLSASIVNAILYIKNPDTNLTQLSEKHREQTAHNLLKIEYDKATYFISVKRYFENKINEIKLKNNQNLGFLITLFLYCDEIQNIWNCSNDFLENKEEFGEKKMSKNLKNTPSLNQILYGPPGTGKTYRTITKALEIIDGFVPENREDAKAKFEAYKEVGQIEFVTFHQSYGYEEFVEGIKAKTTESGIEYKIEAGILKKLSKKATVNFDQAQENRVAKKDFDVIFKERILDKLFEDTRLEIKMKKSSFYIKEIDESHIYFDKSGGDSQHVLLLKNLRAMYEVGENKLIIGGLSQYYNPLLEYLLENNEVSQQEKEPLKNYILIIDEINRGNISKIFGELITLIEPSKRIGSEESLHVRLPYSNENFGVPSNLYIIGTMNTADRSIALMDTALRRRFDFTEMMPRAEVLDFEVEGLHVKHMLETINKRIEYLYDRDHTIGHAYFMSLKDEKITDKKVELDNIFKNKIIPLLQEYFYDDWEKIVMVLGKDGFIEKIEVKSDIFTYKNDDYIEEEQSIYTIKDTFDFSEFKK